MGEDQCPHGAEDVDFRDLNGHFTMGDPFFLNRQKTCVRTGLVISCLDDP